MILVDTSVWIDFFRKRNNKSVQFFHQVLEQNIRYGITSFIYQEIIQGAKSTSDLNRLKRYLGSQIFYHPADTLASYGKAATLFFNCRRSGITIRSSIDCLIAQIAIENRLILLHNDNDFIRIAGINKNLQLYNS